MLMISGVVMGVPCSWIPPPVVSVPGISHVSEEGPGVLHVSLCTQKYSQLPWRLLRFWNSKRFFSPRTKSLSYVTKKTYMRVVWIMKSYF